MSPESTTPDLVERWRHAADAFGRSDLDAGLSCFAIDESCDSGSKCGATWDADQVRLIGDIGHIGDRVAARLIWHGAGRGPEAGLEVTGVYAVRCGKITRMDFFWDPDEALKAVGLEE
jgi:hypothetical protein